MAKTKLDEFLSKETSKEFELVEQNRKINSKLFHDTNYYLLFEVLPIMEEVVEVEWFDLMNYEYIFDDNEEEHVFIYELEVNDFYLDIFVRIDSKTENLKVHANLIECEYFRYLFDEKGKTTEEIEPTVRTINKFTTEALLRKLIDINFSIDNLLS